MAQLSGRWLRRVLAVGLVATLPVVASSAPVAAVGNGCPDGGSWTIRWTGALGDGYWEKQANWEPADGVARTPQPADRVCIDTGVGGGVTVGTGEMGSVSTVVAEVEVTSGPDDPALVFTGEDVEFTAETITGPGPVIVDQAKVFADLRSMQQLTVRFGVVVGDLEMATGGPVPSLLTVEGNGSIGGGSVQLGNVHLLGAGLLVNLGDGDTASFDGHIDAEDVDGYGSLVVVEGGQVRTDEGSSLSGLERMYVLDATIDHRGPFRVDLLGSGTRDLGLDTVGPDSILTIGRTHDAEGPITVTGQLVEIEGALAMTGEPDAAGPVDRIEPESILVDEGGTLFLDGVVGTFVAVFNEGTLRVDRSEMRSTDEGPFVLVNLGRLEVGARQGPEADPLRASVVFADESELLNVGEVVAVDPAAELTIGGYIPAAMVEDDEVLQGTLAVAVSAVVPLVDGRFGIRTPFVAEDDPAKTPVLVPSLAWGAGGIGIRVGGVTDGAATRVEVSGLVRDVGDRSLGVVADEHYHPCAGERWPVATFERSALGYRLPTDGDSSVPGAKPSTIATTTPGATPGWSVTASDRPGSVVATVVGTSSEGCSTPAGGRFVSALYVEGTGRVPTDAEYALRAGRSETIAGRLAQARVVIKGAAARDHQIDEQYRRILDRPVAPASQAVWRTRLAGSFWTVDKLRGALYGSAEFWEQNGASLASVTDFVYQRELGRDATAGEQSAVAQQVAAGTSRASVFTALMGTAEVDITAGAAMVERWWARDATLFEAFYVGALLHRGDAEHLVAADLAAGLPLS